MRIRRGDLRRVISGPIAACAVLLSGCGIYTAEDALNPPFGISMTSDRLKFSGDNKAEFESTLPAPYNGTGYTLWFKERADAPYRVIQYNGTFSRPTIPITLIPVDDMTLPPGVTDDNGDPVVQYTVEIAYMEHPDSGKSFLELKDDGLSFLFAVSTSGQTETAEGLRRLESEKVEFGQWP